MSKEHKRRPPVFTPAEEPVIDATGDLDALLESQNTGFDAETDMAGVSQAHTAGAAAPSDENVLKNGWKVISATQHTGKAFLVASDLDSEGRMAFWRKTRVLSHNKWILNGKWSDSLTRGEVLPQPIYYKEV